MIKEFSAKTIAELKYYVYVYSDPDTKKPFYVGKGKGNRVFDHLSEEKDSEKTRKIREILSKGKEPIIEILVHGVDEQTALKVEAAAIDLIGIENLTNQQRGHESSTYGKIEVSLLDSRYSCQELKEEDIDDNIMLIKINQSYHNGMSAGELYDYTRGYWPVSLKSAEKVEYALSIYDGMVIEVYQIVAWFPALTTMTTCRNTMKDRELVSKRFEFIGNIAPDTVRNKYINKSVSSLYKIGEAMPFKYYFKGQKKETNK